MFTFRIVFINIDFKIYHLTSKFTNTRENNPPWETAETSNRRMSSQNLRKENNLKLIF